MEELIANLAARVNSLEVLANTANDAANMARGSADLALVTAQQTQERIRDLQSEAMAYTPAAIPSETNAIALVDAARTHLQGSSDPSRHAIRELQSAIGNLIGAFDAILTLSPPPPEDPLP